MKKLLLIFVPFLVFAQSNQRVKYRYVGVDSLQSNTASSVVRVADSLTVDGNLSVDSIHARQNGKIFLLDTVSVGTTAASSGLLRLPNNQSVAWRNFDNTTDHTLRASPTANEVILSTDFRVVGEITATGTGQNLLEGSLLVNGSVWFDGTTGTTPTSGAGTRLMWIPSKFAFRAGQVTGTEWDAGNIGNYSFATGRNTIASGAASAVLGGETGIASANRSVVLGGSANVVSASDAGILAGRVDSVSGVNSVILGGEFNTVSGISSLTGGYQNKVAGNYNAVFGYSNNTSTVSDVFLYGRNQSATQGTSILFGYGNSADTLNYGHGFFVRHVPLIAMAKDTSVSGLTGSGHGRAYFGLFHERTADTTAYFLSMQRSSLAYNTGDFVLEKTWGARSAAINIPNSLEFMKFLGTDNTLHFNYSKTAGSFGNISVDNGNFVLSGTASNIALGSNFISNGGTDAGLSFDGSNNATFSGAGTFGGDVTINSNDLVLQANADINVRLNATGAINWDLNINNTTGVFTLVRGAVAQATFSSLALELPGSLTVNTAGGNVSWGTYTPTRSAEANLDANVTMTEAQYMRVGNTITVSGRFTADPTLTATATSFEITLPVASNLGAAEDAAGTAFCGAIAGQGAEVIGVVANDTAKIQWVAGDVTSQTWSYTFTYQII